MCFLQLNPGLSRDQDEEEDEVGYEDEDEDWGTCAPNILTRPAEEWRGEPRSRPELKLGLSDCGLFS